MSSVPDSSFEQIGGLIMVELRRRLGTPELAKELPGTLLMNIARDYVKHLERRNEIEMQKLEHDNEDPLLVVVQEGLPLEMRFEILSEFIDQVEQAWQRASVIMEKLLGEVNDADTEMVQAVQALDAEGGGVLRDAQTQQGAGDGDPQLPPV